MVHYHSINIKALSEKEQKILKERGKTKTKAFGNIRSLRNDEPRNPEGTPKGYIEVAFF